MIGREPFSVLTGREHTSTTMCKGVPARVSLGGMVISDKWSG